MLTHRANVEINIVAQKSLLSLSLLTIDICHTETKKLEINVSA